jgi:adenosylcobinamide kinase/adenosylcobinamide-phosphate guanylyltransferase
MCPDLSKITHDKKKEIEKRIVEDVTNMFDSIMTIDGTMVIITLETGFSITPDNHDQAVFRKILGVVNQRIANMCNEVYLSASGIQFKIK